jgi:chemotaxis protein MotB
MLLLAGILAIPACVPTSQYDTAVNDARAARAEVERRAAEETAIHSEIGRLNAALSAAEALAAQRDKTLSAALSDAQGSAREFQVKLDGAIAENDQLRKELTRLGKNADSLLAEKGMLASALEGAKARLEELRKAQAAADARAALFKQLALKFQRMIDAGQLKVALRNGRMVIQVSNDVLFDSGQTEIKPSGKAALGQVGDVLRTIQNRNFQVAGDTDNVPIQTATYPSNWELSTRRAVEVVHFLVARGIRPEGLSAAGYGEFDPVASNDSPQGRTRNRRIEIVLQPNIDELVAVPEVR